MARQLLKKNYKPAIETYAYFFTAHDKIFLSSNLGYHKP